jgi:hypothetical protein
MHARGLTQWWLWLKVFFQPLREPERNLQKELA